MLATFFFRSPALWSSQNVFGPPTAGRVVVDSKDRGDVAPKLLQPFSAPFPLLAAASEPPPVEGEEKLASQEGVEMMRAEASRKRRWRSSSPWTAPGLQGGGVGEDASG